MRWLLTIGRVPFLAIIAVVTAALGYRAAGVEVEISNASMNARNAAVAALRERLSTHFGYDEDVFVTISSSHGLLPIVERFGARVSAMSGVRGVRSVATLQEARPSRVGAQLVPLVRGPLGGEAAQTELEAALSRNPDLVGLLISAERQTAAVVIETEHVPGDDQHTGRLIDAVRTLAIEFEASGDVSVRITGIGVQKHDVSRFVGRDQAVLIPAAVVVIAIVLWAFYRTWAAVVLPLAVTGVTLAWTLGCYVSAGFALNTITALLPPVVMVLSIATTVHVYSAWLVPGGADDDRVERVLEVIEPVRFPCLFTSLTTAIGLASLGLSDTPAVQLFGAFSALGVLIAFFLSFTLVPVVLTYLARPCVEVLEGTGRLALGLERAVAVSTKRPAWVVAWAAAVLVPVFALVPNIRSNTDLVRFLLPSAELHQDTIWIDENFGPVNSIDVLLSRDDGRVLTSLEDLTQIEGFADGVARVPGVRRVLSPIGPIAALYGAEADLARPSLPNHPADLEYVIELLDVFGDGSAVSRFLSADRTLARVTIGVGAVGTARATEVIRGVEDVARATLERPINAAATGAFHQIAVGSQRIVRDQVVTFGVALVLVVLLIGLAFRSVTIMFIALIPNVVPLAMSAAVMAAMNIDLSTGTAMIASVVIGLAVDDTIHYLARFRRELRGGGDVEAAVRATTLGTGRILTITSLVLALGFWVGALGSFTPTIYFALFSGATMLFALVCDLVVLPSCLMLLQAPVRRWAEAQAT